MPIYKKTRLDQLLVDSGLAETRSRAADLVRQGLVSVAGVTALKPGAQVRADARLAVSTHASLHVSRGGQKLEAALDAFGFAAEGRVALDIGASTGGFTEVLLSRGAAKVYSVDVGRDQLHAKLRGDPRVVVLEATDARSPRCRPCRRADRGHRRRCQLHQPDFGASRAACAGRG